MTALTKMSRNVAFTLKVLIRIVPLYIPTTGITSRIRTGYGGWRWRSVGRLSKEKWRK
jgi:hypothetical protein